MPRSELKLAVRSLYSHEVRKDIELSNLKSLKLEESWPIITEEILHEIGCCHFFCVPYLTETHLYRVTSIFVENGSKLKPLGELKNNINKERSNRMYVNLLEEGESFKDVKFKFPHESMKITLQDENLKNKVRVIIIKFSRYCVPTEIDFVNKIFLDVKNNTDLRGKKSVYMVTNVLMANTIEFRSTMGVRSRIFHIGNPSPILFAIDEFIIGNDGELTAKQATSMVSGGTSWMKIFPGDDLYVE